VSEEVERWLSGYLNLRGVVPIEQTIINDTSPMLVVALLLWPEGFTLITAEDGLDESAAQFSLRTRVTDDAGNEYALTSSMAGFNAGRAMRVTDYAPALRPTARALVLEVGVQPAVITFPPLPSV
jgi:hypothetical protein